MRDGPVERPVFRGPMRQLSTRDLWARSSLSQSDTHSKRALSGGRRRLDGLPWSGSSNSVSVVLLVREPAANLRRSRVDPRGARQTPSVLGMLAGSVRVLRAWAEMTSQRCRGRGVSLILDSAAEAGFRVIEGEVRSVLLYGNWTISWLLRRIGTLQCTSATRPASRQGPRDCSGHKNWVIQRAFRLLLRPARV